MGQNKFSRKIVHRLLDYSDCKTEVNNIFCKCDMIYFVSRLCEHQSFFSCDYVDLQITELFMNYELEAIRDLKPPPRLMCHLANISDLITRQTYNTFRD